jgi:diguanylate cyclase (GGDEF)-like protein
MFFTAAVALAVAVYAWLRREYKPAIVLSLLMVSVAIWSFGGAVEAGIIGSANKILWSKISYIGFVFVAPLAFLFILVFSDHWNLIRPLTVIFFGGISLITLILAWTNEYHGWIWSGFHPGSAIANVLIYDHGFWYWVFISFHYALFTIALILLLGKIKQSPSPYRQQIIAICIATLIPAFGGAIYLLKISPIPGLDWSPVSTVFTGLIFAFIIFRYKFLDLVPVARAALVEQMLDGMIVLDDQQRIIDINVSARNMLPGGQSIKIGSTLAEAVPNFSFSVTKKSNFSTQTMALNLPGERSRFIDVRFSVINGKTAGVDCSLLLLRDITKRKNAEIELSRANKELEARIEEIQKLQNQLREESIRDPLTGLYNRRYLEDALEREFARAQRDKYQVGIIMLDIDHFKKVNDSYGHIVGDEVLQKLAKMLVAKFRLEDIICRYGGEEFLIAMPATTFAIAIERVEEFRKVLERTAMEVLGNPIQVTISAGVAVFPDNGTSIKEIVQSADQVMYKAKAAGRNQIIAANVSF